MGGLAAAVVMVRTKTAPVGSSLTEAVAHLEPIAAAKQAARGAEVDSQESRTALLDLAERNEELKAEVGSLERHTRRLTESLAAVRAEADVYRARMNREDVDVDLIPLGRELEPAGGVRVSDTSRELRMVVLDEGAAQGVRPGMVFSVLRGDRVIARVRTVDVRRNVSGAVVEERDGVMPERGDRVIPGRSRKS